MFFNDEKNFYELFELDSNASNEDILNAYLKVKSTYFKENNAHYSIFTQEDKTKALEAIENAFNILKDEQKRIEYNQLHGISSNFKPEEITKVDPTPIKAAENTIFTEEASIPNFVPPFTKHENFIKKDSLDLKVKNEKNWTGSMLKKIRIEKNITLDDMSNYTKISKRYITSIEEEEFKKLPAKVYLRGFIIQICKRLELPENNVLESYLGKLKN